MQNQMSGGDHAAALMALLYLPVVVTTALFVLEYGARTGVVAAVRSRDAFMSSGPMVRLAAFGMVISATIHVALAPSHWAEDEVRAVLFVLDGVALTAVAISAFTVRLPAWRAVAVALLSAEVLAYAGYVVAGVEQLDAVGIGSKVVELAAIGLILVGSTHHVGSRSSWFGQLASLKAIGGFLR